VFAPTVVRKGKPYFAAMMIGALLLASIAVNALIILAIASKV
jgi:hypothetical protein